MNVYDFDETIYYGDSTRDFCIFLMLRHPSLLRFLPGTAVAWVRFQLLDQLSKTEFKEILYRMFADVPDMTYELSVFWQKHFRCVKDFYRNGQQDDDVIISASPEFLLRPCCDELGIRYLLASKVNPENGKYTGVNCYGNEKVRRFIEAGFSTNDMTCFFSDSYSDSPLANYAKKAFLVLDEVIVPWGIKKPSAPRRWLKRIGERLVRLI